MNTMTDALDTVLDSKGKSGVVTNATLRDVKPIKTYAVIVDGFSPILFSARTAAKARATCYRQYLHYNDSCTFKHFLEISSIVRANDPAGIGNRVMVAGAPATTVIPSCGYDGIYQPEPAFMRDDSDTIFTAHRLEVSPIAETAHTGG